jgi:hypothetical protein
MKAKGTTPRKALQRQAKTRDELKTLRGAYLNH